MKKYNKYLVPEKTEKLNLYDVEIVSNTTSAVERIIEGIVVVTPEVTR